MNTQGRKGKFSYNAYYNADKRGDYQDGEGRRWPGHTDTKSDGVKLAYDLTPDHTVTFQYDWMDSKYNGQDLIYIGPYNGRYKSRMWSLTDDWKVDDHWRNKLTYRNNRLETRYGKPLGEGNSQGTVSAPYSVSSDMNYDFSAIRLNSPMRATPWSSVSIIPKHGAWTDSIPWALMRMGMLYTATVP